MGGGFGLYSNILLPHSILLRIVACMGPISDGAVDMVGWWSECGGVFRVSKAYEIRAGGGRLKWCRPSLWVGVLVSEFYCRGDWLCGNLL
ncbi:hypothetical protein V6N11_004488 [Hibiscus sabdariffa]|uniref:Uncharacterized protein n=1 Tax=Hibiscus sabdariffa TaxID=183260 RepID=A0ABR2SH22_9ROSI